MAVERPYPFPDVPGLSEKYPTNRLVCSIAWHLSKIQEDEPFWLPLKQIAPLLNTYPKKISRAIDRLEEIGIKCTDPNYYCVRDPMGRTKAMEYVFVGDVTARSAA